MSVQKISIVDEFNQLLAQQTKFLFLKNSTTCPISMEAYNEFLSFAESNPTTSFYYLNVQEARALSNEIAEKYAVKHESPQALLFVDGQVVWHTSHWHVTESNLQAEWEKYE